MIQLANLRRRHLKSAVAKRLRKLERLEEQFRSSADSGERTKLVGRGCGR